MAITEFRPGVQPTPVHTEIPRSQDKPPERKVYVTPNGLGIDLEAAHFPRNVEVARHERAVLDYVTQNKELSRGVKLWVGANTNNKVMENGLFAGRASRADLVGITDDGIIFGEAKMSSGELFYNALYKKIAKLPGHAEILYDNATLYLNLLRTWFAGTDVDIPSRMPVQPVSQIDVIIFTPHPDNLVIVRKVGHGRFRSIDHKEVGVPEISVKAA